MEDSLRTRVEYGTYSAPVVLCAWGVPRYEVKGDAHVTCTSNGLASGGRLLASGPVGDASAPSSLDGGAPDGADAPGARPTPPPGTAQTAGCSVAASGPGAEAPWWLFAAAWIAARSRNRRKRRG
jgi:MYXO-CTERM domain-containing protein